MRHSSAFAGLKGDEGEEGARVCQGSGVGGADNNQ